MTLRYVENRTADWVPLPQPDTQEVHPAFASMFNAEGTDFDRSASPPPALNDMDHAAGIFPAAHMLQPHTRIYWVEGQEMPAPPPAGDPRWTAVDIFLKGDPRTRPENPAVDGFTSRVFTDADNQDSLGNWSREYSRSLYPWSGPQHQNVPPYLKVGAIPWANGSDNNGHYDLPLWCLEECRRAGDVECWNLFVKIVLHQAGMGVNWSNGNWRYEKARWIWTGDFYPESYVRWSHAFPNALLLFWHLTDELQDAASMVINHTLRTAQEHRADYNGWYGPRRTSWYLRFLQCIEVITEDHPVDAVRMEATHAMDTVFAHVRDAAAGGKFIVEMQGQPSSTELTVPFTAGTWANWLFCREAMWWALRTQNQDAINTLREMIDWLLGTLTPEGQAAYTSVISPEGEILSNHHTSMTHTAIALGALFPMVAMGFYPAEEFRKSRDLVVGALPHGILGNPTSIEGDRDRALGGAAPKIAADLVNGLRSWYFSV